MSSSNCCFLTCIQISQESDQVFWYSHLLKNFPQFIVIHTVKGFGIVNKAEIDAFLELSCFFYDPAMLAIWFLVPLPFLRPAWTSGSSWFMYCWNLAWRILNITVRCNFEHYCVRWVYLWDSWSIFLHCLSMGLEWKLTFSSPVALLHFPNLLAYWVQHFHSIIFQDLKELNWNSIISTSFVYSDAS